MFAVMSLPLIVAVPAATPRTPNVVCSLLLPGTGCRLSGIRPDFGQSAEIRPGPGQRGS
jgi:hypothetical protein